MKNNPKSLSIIVSIIPLLGALLGAFLGIKSAPYLRFLILPWKQNEISPLDDVKNILYVDSPFSLSDDPTNDTLYVVSENGTFFSNTLFQDEWQIATPEQIQKTLSCPTEWLPLIKNNILDTARISYSDEFSGTIRCYVLFKNGHMQVWTHSTSVYEYPYIIIISGGLGLILGAIVGVIARIFIWRKSRNREE
jgi:hypothetical protein